MDSLLWIQFSSDNSWSNDKANKSVNFVGAT